jgi:hypothetical protein
MKPILLSAFALLLVQTASAQKIEFGANGGISYNTAPQVYTQGAEAYVNRKASELTLAGSIEAKYIRHAWEYGVKVEYRELSYQEQPLFWLLNQYLPMGIGPVDYNKADIAKPAIPVKLFVNRRVNFHRLETYGGLSGGFVFVTNSHDPNFSTGYEKRINGAGYCLGLQIGGTYFVSKHIGVNAEISADYMNLTAEHNNYRLLACLPSLGVRYKL